MEKLEIGIIGAGYIGGVHAGVLARDERVRLKAVHDVDDNRAEQLARSSGALLCQSAEELIESVSAVYITTPNTKHTELAIAAADSGKHVFCEKPMATTL
ncbi:MAG TPA: Gfo/Idh/MocA family oxidoreductase, partial [Pyrinomonadaceae bacterium]